MILVDRVLFANQLGRVKDVTPGEVAWYGVDVDQLGELRVRLLLRWPANHSLRPASRRRQSCLACSAAAASGNARYSTATCAFSAPLAANSALTREPSPASNLIDRPGRGVRSVSSSRG